MTPRTKREYLRELVADKNRWSGLKLTSGTGPRLPRLARTRLSAALRGYLPHCDFPGLVPRKFCHRFRWLTPGTAMHISLGSYRSTVNVQGTAVSSNHRKTLHLDEYRERHRTFASSSPNPIMMSFERKSSR